MLQSPAELESESADLVEDQRACYAKGLALLVRREHSCKELNGKLLRLGFSEDMVENSVARLEQEGHLSDARFAEAFVYYRYGRGQGPERIRRELKERGVEGQLATAPLNSSDYDWFNAARKCYIKKFGRGDGAVRGDINERMRRQRFMLYRGFTYEQISYAQVDDDR